MMWKLRILFVFTVCGLVDVSVGQIVQYGQCDPSILLIEHFDVKRFRGLWYEVYRTQNPYQSGECAVFDFKLKEDDKLEVAYSAVNKNWLEESIGTASILQDTAKLTLDISFFYNQDFRFENFFPDELFPQIEATSFWVLMTNYKHYAVTYSCINISKTQRGIFLWVLGREKSLNDMIPGLITTQLHHLFGIKLDLLNPIDHSYDACYVLPLIEPGEPVVLPGQCDDNIPVVKNFNLAEFSGIWNIISRYESVTMTGNCIKTQFTVDNGILNIVNSQVVLSSLITTLGTATPVEKDTTAKFKVILYEKENIQYELWILATDYENYALAYSCINVGTDQQRIYSWIMTRTKELSRESVAVLNKVIDSILVLNQVFYMPVDHTQKGCFYYPTSTGGPIIFPGQCENQKINFVKNFAVNAYLGLWHTIELYPSETRRGTCSNAYYTMSNDKVISIINTEVRNKTLNTVTATATVAEDETAILNVTFPSERTKDKYYVLGTDYITYALVYSCSNVDRENMRVSVWKLSRSKTLPAAAEIAMAVLLSNSKLLDQRYFVDVDQSPAACFFYPEPEPGIPVIFPGECDPLIGMNHFDLSKFQGTWYETESYATMKETGHCISHINTYVNGNMEVISRSVDNQVLGVTKSILTAVDSSGRLIMTINTDDGDHTDIPFWIIDTDYVDYALAYTCMNVLMYDNPDFRTVWSWKLSRTKNQSNLAKEAFRKAIAHIDVLENRYYEPVNQSDAACFYLPDIKKGNPIILPGECDTGIKGVANLDINRFKGTWYHSQSYYIENTKSTCLRTVYTQEGNLITVTNSQVISENLDVVNGTVTVFSKEGRLKTVLNVSKENEIDIWILATDYENYAVTYSCKNMNDNKQQVYSSILSRARNMTGKSQKEVDRIINSLDILHKPYYIPINQSVAGCFFYPNVTDGPVTFRGQCEEHQIVPINNFNVTAFMGLWHTIQTYPSESQHGSCSNTYFDISKKGIIKVVHSDVREQSLYTVTASVDTTLNNDRGVLKIVLPLKKSNVEKDREPHSAAPCSRRRVQSSSLMSQLVSKAYVFIIKGSIDRVLPYPLNSVSYYMDYWILGTDYTNYALAYSCINIDADNMRVTSWKLSRRKTLDAESNKTIVSIMNNIRPLNQKYYQNMDQSPKGCFYYPVPNPKTTVVFPGKCDPEIGMKHFSLEKFQGTWYEIEKYPKIGQSGECIENVFKNVSELTLEMSSSSIKDELEIRTNGNLTATDDSGRLTISIDTKYGPYFKIPFWIVTTDYNDYALVYGCLQTSLNNNPDHRAVWSWKLSRTRILSSVGTTAIDNAIQAIDVLDERYYKEVDQSAGACFHFPNVVQSQPIILPGQCANSIRGMENFNLKAFAGRWRVIESYPSDNEKGTCIVARYNIRDDKTLEIENSEVVEKSLIITAGTATVPGSDGRLHITFGSGESMQSMDYIILDTDYTSYALAYSCANIDSERRRIWSWKLSRQQTLSPEAISKMNIIIAGFQVLHNPYYHNISQTDSDCFYFPNGDPNTEVGFRGQCDPNFPVVEELNITRFMGLWHNIKSYPIQTEIGTCPNTFFSLNATTINVNNTQVIEQSIGKSVGVCQLEHYDGSGRLTITFNENSQHVTNNYWVIATDYDGYALLYSCQNYDDEFMTVYSWQLSRNKTLSEESNEAISEILKHHEILDERYYVERDQSQAGCFYFPDPKPDSPVIFPGECDHNISAVPDFKISDFAGVWHEIASYYYLESGGQCVRHNFTESTTSTMTAKSFSVYNQTLYSSSSPVQLDSDDGSGQLTINIVVEEQIKTIPFWILDTDYTDYALAYGCVNLENDQRQVYSWKLSRTKVQTPAGSTAIHMAMLAVDVLDDMYFGEIQQTDEACFYLPDISLNEPVTFVGQCDPKIKVVPSFDVPKFIGRWSVIESYYAEYHTGSCIEVNYGLPNELSFEFLVSQVVKSDLLSITGAATANSDRSGKLTVTLHSNSTPSHLWILDTDYESYSLVYSCENITIDQRRVWSWKMSRRNSLTNAANNAINKILDSINVLNNRYYRKVDRSEEACFYYPVPDPNGPVVFKGQCDSNMTVFPNIVPDKFEGQWYEVESYPAPFQYGTCPRMTLFLKGGVMHLVYFQVENQLLQTLDGTVRFASNDGSGKLTLIMNVNGQEAVTNLGILDTDYESYALIYSCNNLDSETKAVTSWKISRTPELSPEANSAINAIMAKMVVLDQRYFVNRSHLTKDCFYYPRNQDGNIILSGPCLPSETVPVVAHFSIDKFAGTWYEISRYPSESQGGACVTTRYSGIGGDALSFTREEVINETLNSLKIVIKVDPNGKGIITLDPNSDSQTQIYVLSTNYKEFALLKACHNVNSNQKQIYSWILSRTRAGISEKAQAAIAKIVESDIDLWEGYYTTTAQDKKACFYYPVFDTMPANIIMPAPCPRNIRGMENFDSARFLGKWYEVGRYPTKEHKGQCNRGEYSHSILDETRTYLSYTEVVEQVLESELSIATQTDKTRGEYHIESHINGELRKLDYLVLATDYVSYSLVYSCTNLPDETSMVRAWKNSRTRHLSTEAAQAIDTVISETKGLTPQYFQVTSQNESDCFYIPILNSQLAPRFRGQCEKINRVLDFNIDKYLGWWHEIRSYPKDGNSGECRSTLYTHQDSTYQVIETVVQNNTGVTDTGTVVVSRNGKLLKTTVGRETEEIWVLATDYQTYSLLYSCVNIDSEYKRVWSAIHSKKRAPISPEAEAAIAPFIMKYNVLVEQFYLPVEQSDEVCFHYPSNLYDNIIIPGQCDKNIPVVKNFNTHAFQGDWYHIERYDEVGISTCIGTRVSMRDDDGSFNILNYEVRDGAIFTERGTARPISTDGRGIFQIVFPIPNTKGNTISSIISIVATDYTSFALAYSCNNVSAYKRRVRAWKLSRHRFMSSTGETTIGMWIKQRQEFHQPYFKQIEHHNNCLKINSALIIKNSIIFLMLNSLVLRIL